MNTRFSCKMRLRRAHHILCWLYPYEFRKLRNLFLAAVGMFWFLNTMLLHRALKGTDQPLDRNPFVSDPVLVVFFLLLLFVLMCVGISLAFTTLHHRHHSRQLLLLPASNAEKFVMLWLLYVPVLLVLYSAAFVVADVLRMLTLPLLHSNGSLPSAIPAFFQWLGYFLTLNVPNNYDVAEAWIVMLFIHSLCLCCSVLCGTPGILLSGLILYGLVQLSGLLHFSTAVMIAFIPLFTGTAYWLFCQYPSSQLNLFKYLRHGLSLR